MVDKEKIINEAKRIEEDSTNSAKSHFYAGQFWTNIHLWLGIIAVVCSAIAGTSAFSKFYYHHVVVGVLSIIVAILTSIITFVNPEKQASIHQKYGNDYNALRNDARIFYDIEANNLEYVQAIDALKKLNCRRNELNTESPQIPKWAFKKSRKGIEEKYTAKQGALSG